MRAEDIVDQESFEAWLEEHEPDQGVAVWLAARAALRVLPLAWSYAGRGKKADLRRITFLRCFSLSDVASLRSTSDRLKSAAVYAANAAAANAVNAGNAAAANAANAAANAANAGNAAADAAYAGNAAVYAAYAGNAAVYAANAAAYAEIAVDCADIERDEAQTNTALWRVGSSPFDDRWAKIAQTERSQAATSGDESARGGGQLDWTFWVDWYEDVLEGTPRNISMMEEIALEVDWDKEPGDVLAHIDAIRGKYAVAASPNAETIRQDPADQKFYSEPDTDLPPDDIQDVIDRLKDAVADVLGVKPEANYCIATLLKEHTDKIADVVGRYSHRPLKLYEACIDVTIAIEARIQETELSARDRHLAEFMRQLERSSTDILNDDPEVAKKVRARGYVRISKLNEDEKNRVRLLAEQGAAESKPEFAEELEAAAKVVIDDEADEKERTDAGYELGSRLTRMEKIRRDTVGAADDVSKLGKGGGAVWELITTVYSWFV